MILRAIPFFFGEEPRRLFGFYHPAERPSSIGLVLANAFGDEGIRAHRTVRHVAEAAARAGVPALRFDYDGAGDSAGDDRDPARVRAWIDSVHRAIDELRALAGVSRVALFGVRLGALLAGEAALARDDVAALVALAPVVSGRMHARELRALHRAIGLRESPTGAVLPGSQGEARSATSEGVEEVAGFVLTEETRAELAKLDATRATKRPAPRVLVLERDDMPSNDAWPKKLRELGADVETRRAAGYVEMMLDPHEASVPGAAVDAAVAFVARDLDAASEPTSPARASEPLRSTLVAAPSGVLVRESAERIDDVLLGVLTSPGDGASPARRDAILLLNAGSIYRVGPNRLHVPLARSLAARGHVVLRFDLAGLGDSPPIVGQPENVTYPRGAHADIARAVAFAARQPGVRDVHVAGICSGAYHAFTAAVRGAKVASVVPINPLTYFWHDGTSVILPPHRVAGEAQRYARAVFDPEKWRKLLRGEVQIRAFAEIARQRASDVALRRVRDVARRVGRPFPDDLGADLERAARHGVKLRFVFASDDPGFDLLRGGAGSAFEKLRRRGDLTVDIIEGPNHTFTQVWSQGVLLARLESLFAGHG